jgi:hypothetical protein
LFDGLNLILDRCIFKGSDFLDLGRNADEKRFKFN